MAAGSQALPIPKTLRWVMPSPMREGSIAWVTSSLSSWKTRYQVKIDTATQRCHIQHPTEPYTYTPRVRHNGSGAWVHELDDPMQMSRMQLFRRLGPAAQGLSDAYGRACAGCIQYQ